MSTISVSLSQNVIDTMSALRTQYGKPDLSSSVDIFSKASYNFSSAHPYYSSNSFNGSSATYNFPDGGYVKYFGVILADPGATTGTASSTSAESYFPSAYRLTAAGLSYHNYSPTGFYSTDSTVTDVAIQTLLSTSSASYDSRIGNAVIAMHGSLSVNQNADIQGVITRFTSSSAFFESKTIDGSFKVAGNLITIGQNLSTTQISGTITNYLGTYKDGSIASITGANIAVTGTSVLDENIFSNSLNNIFSNSLNFPNADQINVHLPANLPSRWTIASGTGDDSIAIQGGGSNLSVQAGDGNDSINLNDSGHTVDGGVGIDTIVYARSLANYLISKSGGGYAVTDTSGNVVDGLANVEKLKFSDLTVNLTIQSTAATIPLANVDRIMELYVAFFNRVPDADGLAYWIGQMNAGQSIPQIAQSFYNAGIQYSDLTGFSSGMSNADFVNLVYKNVLGRTGGADEKGLGYWTEKLSDGSATYGSLVDTILNSAHSFKGDATYGYVANLLDNKIAVATQFAITDGLTYNAASDSISHGMAIAAAVTPTDTSAAIALIGINSGQISLA